MAASAVMGPDTPDVAIVTGAASGIGAVVSARLADRGWRVAGVDLERSDTELSLEVDVTDRAAVEGAARSAAEQLGHVSALVTAAGVYEMVPVITPVPASTVRPAGRPAAL